MTQAQQQTSQPPPSLPRIVAVDLQPMAPIEGVVQLQGDITSEATARWVSGLGLRVGGELQGGITSGATSGAR